MTTVPRHARAPVNPDASLFSSAAIAVHTLLFTPVVGASMMLVNWIRLGNVGRGLATAVFGWVAIVAIGALGLAVATPLAAAIGVIASVLGVALGWYLEQQPIDLAHRAAGGSGAKVWPATLGGLAIWAIAWFAYASFSGMHGS